MLLFFIVCLHVYLGLYVYSDLSFYLVCLFIALRVYQLKKKCKKRVSCDLLTGMPR